MKLRSDSQNNYVLCAFLTCVPCPRWKTSRFKELFPRAEFHPLDREPTEEDPEPGRSIAELEDLTSLAVWSIIAQPQNQGLQGIVTAMMVNDQQRDAVQAATVGQSTSTLWHTLREGRLTASNFGAVLPALLRGRSVAPSVIGMLLSPRSLDHLPAIQWGRMNEIEGIKAFEQAKNVQVNESGLWLAPSGMLGASPDGLVGESSIIEVKCPYSARYLTIEESSKNKDFLENVDGHYSLKKKHPYWHQVQGQMHITGTERCAFVTWTTKDSLVLEVDIDESWSSNLGLLEGFYESILLPKLVEQ